MTNAIETRGLTKHFGAIKALRAAAASEASAALAV